MATSDIKKGPLYVDSTNNRVGVGNSSPSSTLHIGTGYSTFQMGANDSTGFHWAKDTSALNLYTGAVGAGTFRFGVDTSGRVTMPNQPYFFAASTHGGTYINNALMPYDDVAHNIGNHYSASTYLFTAPIAGRYLFTVTALNYPSSSTGQIFFSVNGGGFTALMRNHSIVAQQSLTGSAILNLSANDTVGVKGELYFYALGGHGHFSGILLG